MTEEELTRLWDPETSVSGAEAIEDLEHRLASLRGPADLPPLDLPPRGSTPSEPATAAPSVARPVAAALLLAAAALLAIVFGGRPPRPSDPAGGPVARTQQASPSRWRVEQIEGTSMCKGPGIEAALDEGTPLRVGAAVDTGPATTALLRNGGGKIELHPNSRVLQHQDALELAHGRMWAELPPRHQGGAWALRTEGATLHTQEGRFVWWAHEGDATGTPSVAIPRDEIGVQVVSGHVSVAFRGERVVVEAGQRCVFGPGNLRECTAPPSG